MIIGIDLGTCFSAVGQIVDGKPELIPNSYGARITPSCIAVSHQEILVGDDAISVKNDPDFTFIDKSKIFIGSDKTYATPQGIFTPDKVATLIIGYLIKTVENFTSQKPTEAVVTVPAYFNAQQRKQTKEAVEKTDIKVLRIISEPTAASLMAKSVQDGSNILVYDLGGGTFDCSILEVYKGLARVVSTHGDTKLGGQDFDQAIAKYLLSNYEELSDDSKITCLELIEKAKKSLSNRESVIVPLNQINYQLLPAVLTLKELNSCTNHLLNKTKSCIFDCLRDAELEISDIDKVYLVGGSTRLKQVYDLLSSLFNVSPEMLGNPDESVALGATIHAHDISDKNTNYILIDVIPLSLGIEIEDGTCKKIIKRNSPIPCQTEEVFTTAYDNQEQVLVKVFQGENIFSKNNIFLGEFTLDNIEKALRGDTKILVTFSIDENAVISVTAEDIKTKAKNQIELLYNLEANTDFSEDNENEILELSLKNNIKTILLENTGKFNNDLLEMAQSALSTNNIELIQSVLDDLKEESSLI